MQDRVLPVVQRQLCKIVHCLCNAEKEDNGALTLHHLDKKQSVAVVDTFYNLVTDGYELTWDTSFHFSPRPRFTNFRTSQILHEARIAYMARIQPGFKVLDVRIPTLHPLPS